MIPNHREIRDLCCLFECAWTPEAMSATYQMIVASWMESGFPPDKLASQAPDVPGIGNKWGSFKHKRKRLEQSKFEGIVSFSLSHLAEPGSYPLRFMHPDRDWLIYATATRRRQQFVLGWIPSIIGEPARTFVDVYRQIASLSRARYGYSFQQRYNLRRGWEMPSETPAQSELGSNSSWWEPDTPKQAHSLLLRDVFAHNYLSNAHLEASMGRTAMTLREWIEDVPAERGQLGRFTDFLTEWTPPPQAIPHIRESLFRAGRLFYWRFFNPSNRRVDAPPILQTGLMDRSWQEAEPYYRPNLHEPWEATGPIPEIFQASRYHELFQDTRPT